MKKINTITHAEKKYFGYYNLTALVTAVFYFAIILDKSVSREICLLVSTAVLPGLMFGYSWAKRSAKLEELQRKNKV